MGREYYRSRRRPARAQPVAARALTYLALAGLVVLTGGLVYLAVQPHTPPVYVASEASPAATSPGTGPAGPATGHGTLAPETPAGQAAVVGEAGSGVAFLGDGYTLASGSSSGGFVGVLCAQQGWSCQRFAAAGAGYTQSATSRFGDLLPALVATHPSLVIVAGGVNDADATAVPAAAAALFDQLAQRLPRARVVVVGPFWPDSHPTRPVLDVRDAIRTAALDRDLSFIDPIRQDWVTDADVPLLVAADGQTPTEAGYANLARRLGQSLAKLGLAR